MDLMRGQRQRLADTLLQQALTVTISFESAATFQTFCLLLDAQESLFRDQLIASGASACSGGRVSEKDTFVIDLSRLPADVHRIVFAIGAAEGARAEGVEVSHLQKLCIHVQSKSEELYRFQPTPAELGRESAICLIELYRKDGWRITASGTGFIGGIPSLLSRYRGNPALLRPAAAPPNLPRVNPLPTANGSVETTLLPRHWATRAEPSVPSSLIPSMGLVVVHGPEGISTGTGFMIGPGGYFLTCHHVIENAHSIAIGLEGSDTLRPATVVRDDPEGDIALLHINDRNGVFDWLLLASADHQPALGDNLGLLGYPLGGSLGISLTYSQGIINSLRKVGQIPVLQVDTGAAPGSSGGPVFRRSDGRVVGLLTSGLSKNSGMLVNFAVDIRRVWQLGWVRSL